MSDEHVNRVGVLVVGHAGLPEALLAAAEHILGGPPAATRAIGIVADVDDDAEQRRVAAAVDTLDTGAGVLILIDVMGATPYRIAQTAMQDHAQIAMVTGANLAMLVRVLNYPDMDLAERADAAVTAGQRSATRVR